MIILGIDPGLAIVGWGVIESVRGAQRPIAFGAITTPAHTLIESRLAMIESDLTEIINKYKPDEMAVEELFFNTNITTGIAVAEARGVILCTAHKLGVKIAEYTPLQVKQAVVGYGKAEKQQVIAMVTSILRLPAPPKPDDTADAVAIALCHAQCTGSGMGKYFNKRS
jgi:crossover junction endodeoxyribonuclease RuvC